MDQDFTIREATPEDLDDVRSLLGGLMLHTKIVEDLDDPLILKTAEERIRTHLNGSGLLLLAIAEGKPVGLSNIDTNTEDKIPEITDIYLKEDYRGAKGIKALRSMSEQSESFARNQGADKVCLHVLADGPTSRLYKMSGYKETFRQASAPQQADQSQPKQNVLYMTKQI